MKILTRPIDEQQLLKTVVDFYERVLKPEYEPSRIGDYIVLDAGTLDYEVDENSFVARERLQERRPEGDFFTLEVGRPVIKGLTSPLVPQE